MVVVKWVNMFRSEITVDIESIRLHEAYGEV